MQPTKILTELAKKVQTLHDLGTLLQTIVDTAAVLLETERVSLRLLDPDGERLLAVCRSGSPLHLNPTTEFERGEGLMGWIVENRQPILSQEAEADPRFAVRPGMKERIRSFVGVPLVAGNVSVGVISSVSTTPRLFSEVSLDLLMLVAGICSPYIEIARLREIAKVDPLTGVLNRRGLEFAFPRFETGGPFPLTSVVILDVDNFKDVNDQFGHLVGDQALRKVADTLTKCVRIGDTVVRYGGDEFLVILPGVRLNTAAAVAERARSTIEQHPVNIVDREVPVTASVGVAERQPTESESDLIERADQALLRAKTGGRNRVVLDDPRAPTQTKTNCEKL